MRTVTVFPEMKLCGSCRQEKPLSAFAQRSDRGNRPTPYCNSCRAEKAAAERLAERFLRRIQKGKHAQC
jgi:hypothetical protein